jgi:hypothetical protein
MAHPGRRASSSGYTAASWAEMASEWLVPVPDGEMLRSRAQPGVSRCMAWVDHQGSGWRPRGRW